MLRLFSKDIPNNNVLSRERKNELKKLCKQLNIRIKALALLDRALTHSSSLENYSDYLLCYERLEFLGDSILNASISYYLYRNYPDFREGRLTSIRSSIVDEKTLSAMALDLGLDQYLNLGKGENLSDIRAKQKVSADVLEALLAVIYIEKGFRRVRHYVEKLFAEEIQKRITDGTSDYKTQLQKITVERYKEYPVYSVIREKGPDHNKIFEIEVSVAGKYKAMGSGRSKKDAEQKAAKKVLEKITHIGSKK